MPLAGATYPADFALNEPSTSNFTFASVVVPIRTSPPDVMRSLSVPPVCKRRVELFIFPVTLPVIFPVTSPVKSPVNEDAVIIPAILNPDIVSMTPSCAVILSLLFSPLMVV